MNVDASRVKCGCITMETERPPCWTDTALLSETARNVHSYLFFVASLFLVVQEAAAT